MPLDLFIRIRQNDEAKTLVCEILDQGIGIDEKGLERAFLFADSSAQHRWDRIDEQQSYAMVRQPITSLGVGLSLSQMMAQISGGSLKLEYRKQEIELLNAKISTGCTSSLELSMRDEITCNL
jgi:pyruvate dehydrogenase kinase 2/3/4